MGLGSSKKSPSPERIDPPVLDIKASRDAPNKPSTNEKDLEIRSLDDKMTALVKLQMSDGMFEAAADAWDNGVFNTYLGSFEATKSACPENTEFNLWLTALAVKILELKMDEKKHLWELVADKSKKYLLKHLGNNEEEYKKLQEKAEQYVNKGNK